ncbi:hypothetical protein QR680_008751 [Steinernema hermaphroditum]|uniref:Ubiquitin-like domain-containing protein n=1 Tax=Steinernema hermaphroditum TaxID=289476 RepID=A0AA39IK89_9BILA|nr:hypothetical protein QR680_008751 [Steinernema hermaphroditum]
MNNEARRPKTPPPAKKIHLPGELSNEHPPLDSSEAQKQSPSSKSDHEKPFEGSRLTRKSLRHTQATPQTPAPTSPDASPVKTRSKTKTPTSSKSDSVDDEEAEASRPTKSPQKVAVVAFFPKPMPKTPSSTPVSTSPPTTVVMSPSVRGQTPPPRRRRIRTLPEAEVPQPLQLLLPKTATVRTLKVAVRRQTHIRHFTLLFQGKELRGEDSTLESFGISEGATLSLQVTTQAGNSDREDIAQLLSLSRSLSDLRGLLDAAPLMLMAPPKGSVKKIAPVQKENAEKAAMQREAEAKKTRSKMDEIRRKKSLRNPNGPLSPVPKKKAVEKAPRKARSPGSIVTSPRTVFSTTSVSPVQEMAVELAKPVTAKELLLYFDPPESVEERLALRNELFEPPETRAKLEKLKAEMAKTRCGLCRTRLLFSMREMRCKCQKAFCPKHRNPQTHRCSVDFKQMDRQHMRDELTKPTSERLKAKN